jgi:hypothetical protein
MKVIVFTGDTGNACVLTPVYPPDLTQEQEVEFLAQRQQRDIPPFADGTSRQSFIKDSDSSEVKEMTYLFSAWRIDSAGNITLDRAAAEELKRSQFRALRKPLLEKLDVEFMRALESGDSVLLASISTKKKELRDVTLIDMSMYDTPKTLNEFLPDSLKNS